MAPPRSGLVQHAVANPDARNALVAAAEALDVECRALNARGLAMRRPSPACDVLAYDMTPVAGALRFVAQFRTHFPCCPILLYVPDEPGVSALAADVASRHVAAVSRVQHPELATEVESLCGVLDALLSEGPWAAVGRYLRLVLADNRPVLGFALEILSCAVREKGIPALGSLSLAQHHVSRHPAMPGGWNRKRFLRHTSFLYYATCACLRGHTLKASGEAYGIARNTLRRLVRDFGPTGASCSSPPHVVLAHAAALFALRFAASPSQCTQPRRPARRKPSGNAPSNAPAQEIMDHVASMGALRWFGSDAPPTALVISTEAETRVATCALLRRLGCAPVVASALRESEALLDTQPTFDIVLLDADAPGAEGQNLCAKVTHGSPTRRERLLVLARDVKAYREWAEANDARLLALPLRMEAVRHALRTVRSGDGARRERRFG